MNCYYTDGFASPPAAKKATRRLPTERSNAASRSGKSPRRVSTMHRLAFASALAILAAVSSPLTDEQGELVLLLVRHFRGSSCTLGTDRWPRPLVRDGSLYVSVATHDQIRDYVVNVREAESTARKPVIVLEAGDESFSCLEKISQSTTLASATWILLSDEPPASEAFRGIYIPFNCEFVFVHFASGMYFLTEIYHVAKSSSHVHTFSMGTWSNGTGLSIRGEHLYARRKSLMGHVFNASAKSVPPYTVTEGEYRKFGGYLYHTWNEIESRLHFKSKVTMNADEGGQEFALMPVVYDASVLDKMDITQPVYESRSYLFGHRPGSELQWNSYLKPFDAKTWWATLAWMACSAVALATLYKIAWTYGTSEREAEYFGFTLSESLGTVFRAMCMQGSDITPRSVSCRLMFLSIYLTALVVSSAFSAALFSLLTVPISRPPFNDFEEVLGNKAFRIGLVEGNEVQRILQDFASKYPSSIQNRLLERADAHPRTLLEGLNRVCRNRMYVVMSELPYVLHAMQNMTRECQERIMPAGPILLRTFIGIGLRKGSPYKELIDIHILKMRNEGIIKRLLLNNWPAEIPTVQAVWVRVTLSDISPILYMFALGAVLAVALLAQERLRHLFFRKISIRDAARMTMSRFCGRKPETKARTGKNL